MSPKFGPSSQVKKNQHAFLKENHIPLSTTRQVKLNHNNSVSILFKNPRRAISQSIQNLSNFDALITDNPTVTLMLLTADCLPITFFDPKKNLLALAHLSWLSSDLNLTVKVITIMKKTFNANPKNLHVSIGPCIHPDSYLVNNPKQRTRPKWQNFITKTKKGNYHIDLIGYNTFQMTEQGIPKKNITIDPVDTFTNPHYFSHRRSQQTNQPEGRMATIARLPQI